MANTHNIGDQVVMTGTFTTAAGTLTDPTTVTCVVRSPAGTETPYVYGTDNEMTKTSTGVFRCTLTVSTNGTWHYRFKGTGALVAAGESFFWVRPSEFTNP